MSEKTGKGKYGDRQTLMVRKLNNKKLNALFTEYTKTVYGIDKDYNVEDYVAVPLAGQTVRGKQAYAVVMSEGVGYLPTDYNTVAIFAQEEFGGVVRAEIAHFRIEEELLDEEVDLADFIRVFGDRLEGNFSMWYRLATNPKNAQDMAEVYK